MNEIIIEIDGKILSTKQNSPSIIPRIGERLIYGNYSGNVVNVIHEWSSIHSPLIRIVVTND